MTWRPRMVTHTRYLFQVSTHSREHTDLEQWAECRHFESDWGLGVLLKDTSAISCRYWESNQQPSGYQSNSLTIRQRLPPDSCSFVSLVIMIILIQKHKESRNGYWVKQTGLDCGLKWFLTSLKEILVDSLFLWPDH